VAGRGYGVAAFAFVNADFGVVVHGFGLLVVDGGVVAAFECAVVCARYVGSLSSVYVYDKRLVCRCNVRYRTGRTERRLMQAIDFKQMLPTHWKHMMYLTQNTTILQVILRIPLRHCVAIMPSHALSIAVRKRNHSWLIRRSLPLEKKGLRHPHNITGMSSAVAANNR
jgi:hypothetical protein